MSPPRGGPVAFSAFLAAAKVCVEIPSPHLVFLYVLVDALVTYPKTLVSGKPATYLLRAPVFSQQLLHTNPGLLRDKVSGTVALGIRKPLGLLGTVTAFAEIAAKFPAYGGFVHAQVPCNLGLVVTCFP